MILIRISNFVVMMTHSTAEQIVRSCILFLIGITRVFGAMIRSTYVQYSTNENVALAGTVVETLVTCSTGISSSSSCDGALFGSAR